MSSKLLSTTLVHLCSNPISSFQKPDIWSVSFNSQVAKSRISIRAAATANDPTESRGTLYELLGIAETGSSFSDIKKAYKEMARKYHPDVSPPEQVDGYTRRFIMVREAYETLSDPQTRASYDRYLEGGLAIPFSPTKSQRWLTQLDELKRRGSKRRMSWGARMRNQT